MWMKDTHFRAVFKYLEIREDITKIQDYFEIN